MTGHMIRSQVWGDGDNPVGLYFPPFTTRAGFILDVEGAESASVFVRVDFDEAELDSGNPLVFTVSGYVAENSWGDNVCDLVTVDVADVARNRTAGAGRFVELRVDRPATSKVAVGVQAANGYTAANKALIFAAVRY